MSFWDWFHPKPKPPTTTACYVTVCTVDRQLVPGLIATLEIETTGAVIVGVQDPERVRFAVPSGQLGHGAYLTLVAKGYLNHIERIAAVPDMGEVIMPAVPTLGALAVSGHVLTAAGEPFTIIEASSFRSLQMYLAGELDALAGHLAQLSQIGFNTIRVFGMCRNLFDLDPEAFPDYYDRLPAFVAYVARYGLCADLAVFPDVALIRPDRAWQLAHWARVGAALQPVAGTVLVSLQNEADQLPNLMDTAAFSPLDGLICSHGSNGSQVEPVAPVWAVLEMHYNDAFQWPRKVGHNTWELGGCGWASENTRPDHDGVIEHFEDAAAGAALLCAGSCFHSIPGRTSAVLTGYDLDCARAWVRGAQSVPLDCQGGEYHHRDDLEGPNAGATGERVYQRGESPLCIVRIRP